MHYLALFRNLQHVRITKGKSIVLQHAATRHNKYRNLEHVIFSSQLKNGDSVPPVRVEDGDRIFHRPFLKGAKMEPCVWKLTSKHVEKQNTLSGKTMVCVANLHKGTVKESCGVI